MHECNCSENKQERGRLKRIKKGKAAERVKGAGGGTDPFLTSADANKNHQDKDRIRTTCNPTPAPPPPQPSQVFGYFSDVLFRPQVVRSVVVMSAVRCDGG